jgi:hypothetical protein
METETLQPFVRACMPAEGVYVSKGASVDQVMDRLTTAIDTLVVNLVLVACTMAKMTGKTRINEAITDRVHEHLVNACGGRWRSKHRQGGGAAVGLDAIGATAARYDPLVGQGVSVDANLSAGFARGALGPSSTYVDAPMFAGGGGAPLARTNAHVSRAVRHVCKEMECTFTKGALASMTELILREWWCMWHALVHSGPLNTKRIDRLLMQKRFAIFS